MVIDEKVVAEVRKRRDVEGKTYEQNNAFPFEVLEEFGPLGFAVANYGPDEGKDYYAMDNLPADCPFPGNLAPAELIDRLWAPIAPKIPKFVAALKKTCKHNLVFHCTKTDADEKNRRGWFLGYILDRKETVAEGSGRYADMWGREPFKHPKLNKKLRKAKYTLPESLRQFYVVHNGLGLSTERTGGVETINSAKNLEQLPRRLDLVEVYCDSGGNRATFPLSGEDHLVDWDRETHETAKIGSLWALLESEGVLRYVTGNW